MIRLVKIDAERPVKELRLTEFLVATRSLRSTWRTFKEPPPDWAEVLWPRRGSEHGRARLTVQRALDLILKASDLLLFRVPSYRRLRVIQILGSFDGFVACLCDVEAPAIGKMQDVRKPEKFEALVKTFTGFKEVKIQKAHEDDVFKGRGLLIGKRLPNNSTLNKLLDGLEAKECDEYGLKKRILREILGEEYDFDALPLRERERVERYEERLARFNERLERLMQGFAWAFALHELPGYARFVDYNRLAILTLMLTVCGDDKTMESLVDRAGESSTENSVADLRAVKALMDPEGYWRQVRPRETDSKKEEQGQKLDYRLYHGVVSNRFPLQFRSVWALAVASLALGVWYSPLPHLHPLAVINISAAAGLIFCGVAIAEQRAKRCRCDTADRLKLRSWVKVLGSLGIGLQARP